MNDNLSELQLAYFSEDKLIDYQKNLEEQIGKLTVFLYQVTRELERRDK